MREELNGTADQFLCNRHYLSRTPFGVQMGDSTAGKPGSRSNTGSPEGSVQDSRRWPPGDEPAKLRRAPLLMETAAHAAHPSVAVPEELFRVEITARDEGVILLELFGELDVATMAKFDAALEALYATSPNHAIFDLSSAEFISVAGYDAIGRCSLSVEHVTVQTASDMSVTIFALLGYDRVLCTEANDQ